MFTILQFLWNNAGTICVVFSVLAVLSAMHSRLSGDHETYGDRLRRECAEAEAAKHVVAKEYEEDDSYDDPMAPGSPVRIAMDTAVSAANTAATCASIAASIR